jgi:hypothetical protein
MNELTQRLTSDQPVIVGGSQPSLAGLRQRVEEMGYVLIKFTETRGGTELGFRLDSDLTDLNGADFDGGAGTIHVEGTLILNDDPVRCIADIDLSTLEGTGRLAQAEKSTVAAD